MAFSKRNEAGFSLLELSLSIAIGLTILASSIWMLKQHNADARVQQTKMMLATIRTSIASYRYRYGTPPTYVQLKRNWVPTENAQLVQGVASRSATQVNSEGGAIPEPVSGMARAYDRKTGSTDATQSYGGWCYDEGNGTVSVNLNVTSFPGDNPALW